MIAQATPFYSAVYETIKIGLTIPTTTLALKVHLARYDVSRREIGQ